MKQNKFFRRTISAIAAVSALFTAAAFPYPVSAAEGTDTSTASTLPTHLMNGDFEWPSVKTALEGDNTTLTYSGTTTGMYKSNSNNTYNISNIDGENVDIIAKKDDATKINPWFVTRSEVFNDILDDQNSTESFYWNTTASNGKIELAASNLENPSSLSYFPGGTAAKSGSQFAELVGTELSSLYQSISTTSGSILTWDISHRARRSDDAKDSMAVFIGPRQAGLKKSGADSQDIFYKMAELITANSGELDGTVGMSTAARHIYSVPVTDEMEISDSSVSTVKTNTHTEEWTCWIITSDSKSWHDYRGSYTVPTGQTETTFAFTALNSTNGGIEGNCLDGIQFGIQHPLIMTATAGGTGAAEGAGISVTDVAYLKPFTGSANAGETVTITATPTAQGYYLFMGAEINGAYVPVSDFTKQADGTYTYPLEMTEAKNVHLMFASQGVVRYDPNGGTLPTSNLGLYNLTATSLGNGVTQVDAPTITGGTFKHWEVYTFDGTNAENLHNATVSKDHTITFTDTNGVQTFTITDNSGTAETPVIEINANATNYAILLRAVYTHTLSAAPATRYFGDADADWGNSTGGTVSITNDTDKIVGGDSVNVDYGDTFTITATPKKGYAVDSWWYEFKTDAGTTVREQITVAGSDTTYSGTFRGSRNAKIYALFTELPISAHLAAVAKDEPSATEMTSAGIAVGHGNVAHESNIGSVIYNNTTYGDAKYGNTISTGFFATREITGSDVSTSLSGTWTVNVPALGSYFKLGSKTTDTLVGSEVITTDGAEVNPGAIYDGGEGSKQIKLNNTTGTIITNGTANVVFGIVIDNLYAPNAQAGFKIGGTDGTALDSTNSVTATDDKAYDQSELDAIYNQQ